jgi:hypothetical protein
LEQVKQAPSRIIHFGLPMTCWVFLGFRVNFLRGMGEHHDMERIYESQDFNIESCSFKKSAAIILIKNMMMQASIFNVEQGPSAELLRRPSGWIARKVMQVKNFIEVSFVLLYLYPVHNLPTCA